MNSLVTVVIPSRNYGHTIGRAIRSVQNQTYNNIELIIADYGSDDNTESVVNEFDNQRLIFERISGTNANSGRNAGLLGRGDYIAYLDADDEYLPVHIAECMAIMDGNPADGLYGSCIIAGTERVQHVRHVRPGENMINYLLSAGYGAQTSTLFVRREAAAGCRWDEGLNRHQDYDFVTRFAERYTWDVKLTPSVRLHRIAHNYKTDILSCIRFIERNKKDVAPNILRGYMSSMYRLAIMQNEPTETLRYYIKELEALRS